MWNKERETRTSERIGREWTATLARVTGCVLDLVYPPGCISCGARLEGGEEGALCEGCRKQLPLIGRYRCPRCGDELGPYTAGARACPSECRRKTLYFRGAVAVCRYEGVARDLVQQLKYRGDLRAATWMGRMMLDRLRSMEWLASCDCVVPVPLHWSRRLGRRFNQSELLARAIAEPVALPVSRSALARTKRTSAQATLAYPERARNVKGAFRAREDAAVNGRRILLVDDVMTTCATAAECARALLKAGAASVHVAVFGR